MHAKRLSLLTFIFCTLAIFQTEAFATTESEKNESLEEHNNRRVEVSQGLVAKQPPASNMTRLAWDEDLYTVAQNSADDCIFKHNATRRADYKALSGVSDAVGENLYVASSPRSDIMSDGIKLWFEEHQDYDFSSNDCGSGSVCGHYTQVVWANTARVGCAIAECPAGTIFPNFSSRMMVCNYAPAGNIIGRKPYLKGKATTNCPESHPEIIDGLCSQAEKK